MRNLLIVAVTLISTVARSQDCSTLVEIEGDQAFQFIQIIQVNHEKSSLFVKGIAQDQVVAVVFVSDDKKFCQEKGDSITLRFSDNRVFRKTNDFDSNCDGRYALYLSAGQASDEVLKALASNDLVSITIRQREKEFVYPIETVPAQITKDSFKCLAECLTNEELVTHLKERRDEREKFVFTVVEQQAQFIGGFEEMARFIQKNMKKVKDVSGSVFVSFVVGLDGSITDVAIVKGLSEEANLEAMRLVKAMPNWSPGKQNGRPVRTRFVLPIRF